MIFEGFASKEKIKQNPRKSSKKHRFAWKNQENLPKSGFSLFFQQNDDFLMIFWWCLKVLLQKRNQTKPRKSSKNHQKIVVLLEKPRKLAKILDFQGFSSKTMIFWLFSDDFLMIFEGFASKAKIKQNLGNHQKIIKKSSFCWKNLKSKILASFLSFFQAKRWFFDDFLGFVWFSLLKQNLQTSSKNHRFAGKTMKIQDFGKFSWFFQAKRWFFDSFLMIFWWFLKVLLQKRKSNKT